MRQSGVGLLLAALAALSGCLQLDVRIALQPDGSAVITERFRVSRGLLDLDSTVPAKARISPLQEKAAFLERMKHMGKGLKLVSHKIGKAEKGAREAVAVYKIDDIRELKYVTPFLALAGYPKRSVLTFNMIPLFQDHWAGRRAGQMAVIVKPIGRAPRQRSDEAKPKPPSPRELQILRDLQPVFRDMTDDFKLKLTFESYGPLRFRQYYRYRGMRAGTREFDLLDFSDADLDNFGYGFLENQEIMLELLHGQVDGPNIVEHVKQHGTNLTLPVFHPTGVPEIYFRPSRPLFEKYLAGKTLTFDPRRSAPRKADFKKDGWHGNPAEALKSAPPKPKPEPKPKAKPKPKA